MAGNGGKERCLRRIPREVPARHGPLHDLKAPGRAGVGAAVGAAFDGLQPQRLRIGTPDLRIAAIALSRSVVVLTRNVADFGKVPGLVTEDLTR